MNEEFTVYFKGNTLRGDRKDFENLYEDIQKLFNMSDEAKKELEEREAKIKEKELKKKELAEKAKEYKNEYDKIVAEISKEYSLLELLDFYVGLR